MENGEGCLLFHVLLAVVVVVCFCLFFYCCCLVKNADVLVMHKSLYFTFSQFAFAIRFIFYAAFCTV